MLLNLLIDAINWASPSTRRAWVEILHPPAKLSFHLSPSTRRAWVEIFGRVLGVHAALVALYAEGVGRNF